MKTILVLLASLMLYAPIAGAQGCVTNTYIVNGKVIICTTCCYYGNCTTTCV